MTVRKLSMAYQSANNLVSLSAPKGLAHGLYRPKSPLGYVLQSKTTECQRKFYFNKPIYDATLFELIPVYEVEAD